MIEMGQGTWGDWSVGGAEGIDREEKGVISSERDDFGGSSSE